MACLPWIVAPGHRASRDGTPALHRTQRLSDHAGGNGHRRQRSSEGAGADALTLARAALERSLPPWNSEINQVPESVTRSTFDPERFDALDLAKRFSSENFAFSEVRINGRTVYKSADGESTVKVDTKNGYWKLISPLSSTPATPSDPAIITDDGAAQRQSEVLKELEIPTDQVGETRSAGVATSGREGDTLLHGRSVTTLREINGLTVEGSAVKAIYNLDGSVAWLERRWPKFSLDSSLPVMPRERVIDEIAAQLEAEYAKDAESLEVLAKVVYEYDEATGKHLPNLHVALNRKGTADGEILKNLEYHLTGHPGDSQSSSDIPSDG
jgi:hypothetical protein